MATDPGVLLHAQDYSLRRESGPPVLQSLSFQLERGKILGVAGESGSGKSQLLLSLLGLAMPGARTSGSCRFDGTELAGAGQDEFRKVRGRRIAMLFQDPLLSWNPCLTVGRQLTEVLQIHRGFGTRAAAAAAADALAGVGLAHPARVLHQYPHELSGGMRQRAMLAMAILAEPELLLADEPTTALDATTQIAMLDLLASLRDRGMAILLVTHDLGVLARVADHVMVLRSGVIVEQGATRKMLRAPDSPYARELLRAAQQLEKQEFRQ